ncbi:MAG: hypothetical protein K9N21_11275 [Deltaproteobacteria bacterium]|nr:hypothetical protein [Deltaproteobacteria bacterium]
MTKPIKTNRSISNLIKSLKNHVDLLKEYHERACLYNDVRFLGEIAGKLRILVCETRTNKPLLMKLMDDLECKIPIRIDQPKPLGGPIVLSLREYLNRLACSVRTESGRWVELSKTNLIALWAQQYGASHEDWEVNEELVAALDPSFRVGNLPAAAHGICIICKTVIVVASEFIKRQDELA